MLESGELARSSWRVIVAYLVTSLCLASAWHVTVPFGLWIANATAGVMAITLSRWALKGQWLKVIGWSKRDLVWGLALGIVLVIATQVAARTLLVHLPPVLKETRRLYAILDTPPGPLRAAPIIWLVVIAEELVYRGVVTGWCARKGSFWFALLASTALYVVPLLASGSWLLVVIGISLGTLWTFVRLRSGGILVSLLSHALWSCSTFVVFPLTER